MAIGSDVFRGALRGFGPRALNFKRAPGVSMIEF